MDHSLTTNNCNIVDTIFQFYDENDHGELTDLQLQRLHADLRIGGISLAQVRAALLFTCISNVCDKTELIGTLQEMDRRYYLMQDLKWEFSLLDSEGYDSITEDKARWFVKAVHGDMFIDRHWREFIKHRPLPGSNVRFPEIEVMLCDIPSRNDKENELQKDKKENEQRLLRHKSLEKAAAEEIETEKVKKQEARDNKLKELEKQREDEMKTKEHEEGLNNKERTEEENNKLHEEKQQSNQHNEEDSSKQPLYEEQNQRHTQIRYQLKVAIQNKDKFKLENSVKEFVDEGVEDYDMDLEEAKRLIKEITAKEGLKKAITKREIQDLEKAMTYVKINGFEAKLSNEMVQANKILHRLKRLERIRHEILELKQSTVAEIRSYSKPPLIVHTVMKATLLLISHNETETKSWKTVQAIVGKTGKESIKRKCLECNPSKLDITVTARCKALLNDYEMESVRDVSAGAATFYIWAVTTIEEAEELERASRENDSTPVENVVAEARSRVEEKISHDTLLKD